MVVVGFSSLFVKKSRISIGLTHNPVHSPSERNLKEGERDKFDRHFYEHFFLQKYRDKFVYCNGNHFLVYKAMV